MPANEKRFIVFSPVLVGGVLRVSEEPLRAAFLAGVTRLWAGMFSLQIEKCGLKNENVGLDQYDQGPMDCDAPETEHSVRSISGKAFVY
jgi:hypothetical protein